MSWCVATRDLARDRTLALLDPWGIRYIGSFLGKWENFPYISNRRASRERPPSPDVSHGQSEEAIEINREAIDIARPHPQPPAIESVLVFTNRSVRARRIHSVAWNRNGDVVGRLATYVPSFGVRYMLASDFGRSFLGSATCTSYGRVVASAFMLAPGLTNLPTETGSIDHAVRMRFDLLGYQP